MNETRQLREMLPAFTGHKQHWQRTPFNLKVGRQTWTVACDGAYLVAIQGKGDSLPVHDQPDVLKMLEPGVVKPAYGVEVSKLKEWAGSVPSPEERNFSWQGIDEEHWGAMFGYSLDRRRLACILEHLPFGMVQVWDASSVIGVLGIGLEAKGFRALLAGLKGPPEPSTPIFDLRRGSAKAGTELLEDLPQE